jgi:hypothetical protein
MNIFRSHIARLYGFLLLLTGIALSFVHPMQQKENQSAFTTWLGSHLRSDYVNVHQKLKTIGRSEAELDEVIRRASQLVKSNSDKFEFPISGDQAQSEDDVYRLLVTQWNNYRTTGSSMGNAVRIEPVKSHSTPTFDSGLIASVSIKNSSLIIPNLLSNKMESGTLAPSYILSPNKSGTAIGAP